MIFFLYIWKNSKIRWVKICFETLDKVNWIRHNHNLIFCRRIILNIFILSLSRPYWCRTFCSGLSTGWCWHFRPLKTFHNELMFLRDVTDELQLILVGCFMLEWPSSVQNVFLLYTGLHQWLILSSFSFLNCRAWNERIREI